MPVGKYTYVATVDVYGVTKTFRAESIRELSRVLKISHVTAYRLVKSLPTRQPVTVVCEPKDCCASQY